jgi:glycosyltransferase involved in cell wall biosynthesis
MRVVFVIPTLDRSGAEKQLALLASRLPRAEFDPHVIALTRGGPYARDLEAAGIPLTILNKRLKFDPAAAWKLRNLLDHLQPDIVHSWLFAANAYTRLCASFRLRRHAKFIVSERCVDSWKSGWQLALDRRLAARTDLLLANSQAVADFYQGVGYSPDRIQVIPNAVEIPPRPDFSAADLKAQLEFSPDAKIVMYAGRLARQKRVDDLLWAGQLLRQADPRTRLVIIGDGPERDRLLHFAEQLEFRDYVRFVGSRADAASLLHLADVFWLASDFEGLSNSLMEALACGKPAVVSDIPPNRELVTHGREGFIVDAGDAVAYTEFTRQLFDDPERASQMGTAGTARMMSQFSLKQMVERHALLYRMLVAPA